MRCGYIITGCFQEDAPLQLCRQRHGGHSNAGKYDADVHNFTGASVILGRVAKWSNAAALSNGCFSFVSNPPFAGSNPALANFFVHLSMLRGWTEVHTVASGPAYMHPWMPTSKCAILFV